MSDIKHKWLTAFEARLQNTDLPASERKSYLELLTSLLDGVADNAPSGRYEQVAEVLASRIFSHHNLLGVIRQQAAELDAVKRLTYNLTANLELQTVLDNVVAEAMQLVKNSRNAHIYLYQNDSLRFGAIWMGRECAIRNFGRRAPTELLIPLPAQKRFC